MNARASFEGNLDMQVVRRRPHIVRGIKLPGLGRLMHSRDPGDASLFSREWFATQLSAVHRDGDGRLIQEYDLGSGLVTNIGVLALANDPNWTALAELGGGVLTKATHHAWGTGTTAATAHDLALETPAKPTETESSGSGTSSLISGANKQELRNVQTITAESTLAITEWGLFAVFGGTGGPEKSLSQTTGSPFTKTTATGGTVTGTPYTASSKTAPGLQKGVIKTAEAWGLVTANTSSVVTIPAWYKNSGGEAAATPAETAAFTLIPVMWDHKVFAAINVVSGDSIQFTYSLLINSGG